MSKPVIQEIEGIEFQRSDAYRSCCERASRTSSSSSPTTSVLANVAFTVPRSTPIASEFDVWRYKCDRGVAQYTVLAKLTRFFEFSGTSREKDSAEKRSI